MSQIKYIRILKYLLEPDYADDHRKPGFRRPDDFGSNMNLEMNNGRIVELQFYILRGKLEVRDSHVCILSTRESYASHLTCHKYR